jgi:PAS domain S-box-containing protein
MLSGGKSAATVSVLLVEDDEATRESLGASLSLRYPGIALYSAVNGAQGLLLFQKHRPGIVITDISMPVMDGIIMASKIRLLDPETIIIAVTAHNDSHYLLKAFEIGINQYFLKPTDLGTLLGAVGKHIDTFMLKRELGRQNNRIRILSLAVEQNPSSVMITNAEGIIEYVNPKFTAVSGYSQDEVIGQNPRILKSGLTAPATYSELWRTISRGGVWQGELQNRKKNGELYWVSMVVSALHDDDGTLHYVAVREIISDRKIAEQEHRATIELLRIINASAGEQEMISASTLFFRDQSGCQAVGIRLRDGEDYPYYLAQGFSSDFVIAENSLSSRKGTISVRGQAPCGGLLARGDTGSPLLAGMCGTVINGYFDSEKPFFTDGGSFWTNSASELHAAQRGADHPICTRHGCSDEGFESLALIPLSVGSERLGLLQLADFRKGLFTRQYIGQWEKLAGYLAVALLKFRAEVGLKQLNEDLEKRVVDRTQSLETALREQESFSYSVSHDLRAPLRHINSYLALVSEDYGELLPAGAHNFLECSRTACRRMGKLIDDLLELSRVSRTNLVKESVNLSELASIACSLMHETDPGREVALVIHRGLRARGDKSLLRQMMVNLLENAWKYTSANPAARIEFGKTILDGQETFYLRDNGVGFDMAYSDKLFGEFQRLHGPEYEGTGIGLATVKRIIDRHRGKVWAESKPGKGATFYFVLP